MIPKTGEVLHNGAVVIEATNRVILAQWINEHTPFVTWVYYGNDPRTTAHGHYYTSLYDAVADYQAR
jgi:hypothetical protein